MYELACILNQDETILEYDWKSYIGVFGLYGSTLES